MKVVRFHTCLPAQEPTLTMCDADRGAIRASNPDRMCRYIWTLPRDGTACESVDEAHGAHGTSSYLAWSHLVLRPLEIMSGMTPMTSVCSLNS